MNRGFPAPSYPTPVQRCDGLGAGAELWIKNDGRSHPVYGGNKVRKAQRLIEEALRRGARRVLTVGAVGSHHVLTMALFSRAAGLRCAAVLIPQPRSEHVVDTVRAALGAELEAHAVQHASLALAYGVSAWRPGDYLVPPGGSNVLGTSAYADAVDELALQIQAGILPEPDWIVVPVGSGGTCAGILAGVIRAGWSCRVLGVQVVPGFAPRAAVSWLARRVLQGAGLAKPRAELEARLLLDAAHIGRGYGFATEAGEAATRIAAGYGLQLEQTYTAKTFARALELVAHPERSGPLPAGRPLRVLYWHTSAATPLDDLLAAAPSAEQLPVPILRLLR